MNLVSFPKLIKPFASPDLKLKFLPEALAEREDNAAHKTRQFPKTRLHKVVGVKTKRLQG